MALKAIYDTQEEIPENFRELYTERSGKWELTGIEGVKTTADVERVQEALRKEKADHKTTKDKLKTFDGIDPEQSAKDAQELEELRARVAAGGGGQIDEEKLQKLVDAKVATLTAPLNRDLQKITKERDTLAEENGQYKQKETVRTITDAVRKAASGQKIVDTAMEDVLMLAERVFEISPEGAVLTRDNVGVTPGIAADIWLTEMQEKRPHWWPLAQGGGAGGGAGGGGMPNNPFSDEHWNLTLQGQMVRTDRAKAERMAKAAGTTIGGARPAKKAAA